MLKHGGYIFASYCPHPEPGYQCALQRRAGAGAANSPPPAKSLKQKPLLFRFLIKHINFLLKSTQLELRKNTETVTQKVDTNAQTRTCDTI
jgi:hypothetical protein